MFVLSALLVLPATAPWTPGPQVPTSTVATSVHGAVRSAVQEVGREDDPSGTQQDGPRLPTVTPAQPEALVDVNGAPLVPGQLPEGTAAPARERMDQLFAATWIGEGAPLPMAAFVVTFDARVRQELEGGTSDLRTRFLFREEGRGWIRGEFPRSGRASVRGPEGDWLLDGDEVVDLSDFSNAESRREHERWLAVARNFAALSAPSSLRVARVDAPSVAPQEGDTRSLLIGDRPVRLPTAPLVRRGLELVWLELESPDFDLVEGSRGVRGLRRVLLGLDPATGRVELARIAPRERGPWDDPEAPRAAWVQVKGWEELGSRRLPKQLLVHRELPATGPAQPERFESRAGVDLYLVPSQTRPDAELEAADFGRPTPR